MLTEQEVKDKLSRYAEQFDIRIRRKEWAAAKMLYFRAQAVATFLEFQEAELAALFGNRAYKEDWEPFKDGIFPEQEVLHLKPLQRYGAMYVKGWEDLGGGAVKVQLEEAGA